MSDLEFNNSNFYKFNSDIDILSTICKHIFSTYNYNISDLSFDNLLIHLYVLILRIKNDEKIVIGAKDKISLKQIRAFKISKDIADEISKFFNMKFSYDEIAYIAIHLLAKRSLSYNKSNISKNADRLVVEMINTIDKKLNLNLSEDLDLRINLGLHIMPLLDRINYDLILKNPILKEVKEHFTAYQAAVIASEVINKKYDINLAEDEIGYLAIHFMVSIDKYKTKKYKKNILIVCGSGKATANLMKYSFEKEFGDYIKSLNLTNSMDIKDMNLNKYDLIITSVPICNKTDVPIIEVGNFLKGEDLKNIRKLITKNDVDIYEFFDKKLFIPNLKAKNKKDSLEKMVNIIKKNKEVDDNLLEEIYKREKLAKTEFDNLIAIPHPLKPVSKESFITVAILEKPIIWDLKKVMMIVIFCIKKDETRDLEKLFSTMGRLLTLKDSITKVIESRNFNTFLEVIKHG
ncbi:MAG: PRD domain-containing protein [Tissierellia bacterium]|nr:PRD domain-containing protein [Tissierellia bacterium]